MTDYKKTRHFESLALILLTRAIDEIYTNSQRDDRDYYDDSVYEIVRELCRLAVEHLKTRS